MIYQKSTKIKPTFRSSHKYIQLIFKKKTPLLFFTLFVLNSFSSYSQNALHISLHHDFKLLAFGDQLGNRAGTLNFITRLKYETKDNYYGYMIYGLEFEKAFLTEQYSRYGGFTGFTFMDVFNDYNFHVTPSIGAGFINRTNVNIFSFEASLELEYFLSDKVRLSFLNQVTQRTDLKLLYNDLKYRYSFFVGIQYRIFEFKKD